MSSRSINEYKKGCESFNHLLIMLKDNFFIERAANKDYLYLGHCCTNKVTILYCNQKKYQKKYGYRKKTTCSGCKKKIPKSILSFFDIFSLQTIK